MLYTVLWNPEHRHKRPRGDLLRLRLRSLRVDVARGLTRRQIPRENPNVEPERPHKGESLKARWRLLIPLNRRALTRFGRLRELVSYVTALDHPAHNERMRWAGELAEALERHLGLGDDPKTRRRLYWKVALTCLRALVYRGEAATTPILMVKRALYTSMEAQGKYQLHNVGAFFSRCLRQEGFFDLALFYARKRVA
jgi:hypothetical protein